MAGLRNLDGNVSNVGGVLDGAVKEAISTLFLKTTNLLLHDGPGVLSAVLAAVFLNFEIFAFMIPSPLPRTLLVGREWLMLGCSLDAVLDEASH